MCGQERKGEDEPSRSQVSSNPHRLGSAGEIATVRHVCEFLEAKPTMRGNIQMKLMEKASKLLERQSTRTELYVELSRMLGECGSGEGYGAWGSTESKGNDVDEVVLKQNIRFEKENEGFFRNSPRDVSTLKETVVSASRQESKNVVSSELLFGRRDVRNPISSRKPLNRPNMKGGCHTDSSSVKEKDDTKDTCSCESASPVKMIVSRDSYNAARNEHAVEPVLGREDEEAASALKPFGKNARNLSESGCKPLVKEGNGRPNKRARSPNLDVRPVFSPSTPFPQAEESPVFSSDCDQPRSQFSPAQQSDPDPSEVDPGDGLSVVFRGLGIR